MSDNFEQSRKIAKKLRKLFFGFFKILSHFRRGRGLFQKNFPARAGILDIGTPAPQGDPGAGFSSSLGDRFATEGPRERLVNFFGAGARGSVRLAILLQISRRLKNS